MHHTSHAVIKDNKTQQKLHSLCNTALTMSGDGVQSWTHGSAAVLCVYISTLPLNLIVLLTFI